MIDLDYIESYRVIKTLLVKTKIKEMEMRLIILDDVFPSASVGTFNENIGPFKIKGSFKNTTKLDAEAFFDGEDDLTDAERCCVKLTPSIIAANYKLLGEHDTSGLLDDMVTITPAAPAMIISLEDDL